MAGRTGSLRVAALQLRSGPEVGENLVAIGAQLRRAADLGVRLAVAPEAAMVAFGGPVTSSAQHLDGRFVEGLRARCAQLGMWAVAGMFEPSADGRVHNTLVATDGDHVVAYRKRHLFDAFGARESATVAPGTELPPIFEVDGVRVALSTCYDVRFADQFTDLGRRGAQVVCLPASWASGPGKIEQWRLLTRSRAMDAQAWLIACDQAGDDATQAGIGGRHPTGVGRSLISGPLGEVVAELGPTAGVLAADLDLDRIDTVRRGVPVLG